MTAHHPQLLDQDPYRHRVDHALLDALVDLNEYLHALAFPMRAAVEPSAIRC